MAAGCPAEGVAWLQQGNIVERHVPRRIATRKAASSAFRLPNLCSREASLSRLRLLPHFDHNRAEYVTGRNDQLVRRAGRNVNDVTLFDRLRFAFANAAALYCAFLAYLRVHNRTAGD